MESAVAAVNSRKRIAEAAQEGIEDEHYLGEQQGSYPRERVVRGRREQVEDIVKVRRSGGGRSCIEQWKEDSRSRTGGE